MAISGCPNDSERFNDSANIEYYDNESFFGFSIEWDTDKGFGETSFSINKDTKKVTIGNECLNKDSLKKIVDTLVDTNPESIRKMFHKMIDEIELYDKL
jgi:hypothetical protein|tara:strand:- start:121 stop:417 length:297 start_codon:yes stop_codon:yes gene_type:complete